MKQTILAFMAFILAANTMTAQINADDILDSLINDVQQGKDVENVEISLGQNSPVQHRLLVVGDDQLQGIGPRLYNYAYASGYPIFTSIWVESTTKKWAFSSDLRQLIKKVKPTFVIVCLGTYDLEGTDISTRTQAVKTIMGDIGDIPFVWIGPVEVKTISEGGNTLAYTYGYDQQRIRMVENIGDITRIKDYVGVCEYITEDDGENTTEKMLTYLVGPFGVFAVVEKQNNEESVHYILKDHLGSWTTITDSEGNVEQELSFDAWGNLRNPNTWTDFTVPELVEGPMFDRGFTGHDPVLADL